MDFVIAEEARSLGAVLQGLKVSEGQAGFEGGRRRTGFKQSIVVASGSSKMTAYLLSGQ